MITVRAAVGTVGRWTAAHIVVRAEEYLFDYVLYPYALYFGGPRLAPMFGLRRADGYWIGFACMCVASASLNILYVRLYDRSDRDWFGFEATRRLEARWLARLPGLARSGLHAALFAYLSVWHSPLFATLWIRSPASPRRMQRKDWPLFALSLLLANVGWTALLGGAAWIFGLVATARGW